MDGRYETETLKVNKHGCTQPYIGPCVTSQSGSCDFIFLPEHVCSILQYYWLILFSSRDLHVQPLHESEAFEKCRWQ